MKNLMIFAFFVMAMVMVQFAQAQTADEVVDKYIAALGGKEKLSTLKTIKMEGSMNVQGYDLSITNTKSHMVGMRMDIEVGGTSNYQIINPTKGSAFWPIRGMADPEDMEADQFKSAVNQLDAQGALNNYKEKGTTVELLGKETIAGAEAYKLKITYKNGVTTNSYIDTKTYRLLKTEGKMNVGGQETNVETSYADYKQNADGFWFAYAITNAQGTITYDKISTNIPVDEAIFKN